MEMKADIEKLKAKCVKEDNMIKDLTGEKINCIVTLMLTIKATNTDQHHDNILWPHYILSLLAWKYAPR